LLFEAFLTSAIPMTLSNLQGHTPIESFLKRGSFVRSLLRAGVQPTLDSSAETFMSFQCASPGRGGELVGVCGGTGTYSVPALTGTSSVPSQWA